METVDHAVLGLHSAFVFPVQPDIAIRQVVAGFSPRSFSLTERSFVDNRARSEAHDYVPDAKLWLELVRNAGGLAPRPFGINHAQCRPFEID